MTNNSVWLNVEEAIQSLDSTRGDLLLDFSAVERVDAAALGRLEQLSAAAREKGVKVTLRGAPVHVYKVLKLNGVAFTGSNP